MRHILDRIIIGTLALALFAVLLTHSASAATINVAPGGDDTLGDGSFVSPYQTITKALMIAGPGDTVQLDYGTYSFAATGETFPLSISSGETVRGMGFADSIIAGDNGSTVVSFEFATNATLEGVTVSGSANTGIIVANSTAIIARSRITQNQGGGGISISSSNARVENCLIDLNSTTAFFGGGGLCIDNFSTGTIVNCTIVGNAVGWGFHGSGITNNSSTAVLFNNILWDNKVGDLVSGPPIDGYYSMAPSTVPPAYSTIQSYGALFGGPYGGSGNSSNDPLLVGADYNLQESPVVSAAIDSGTSSYSVSGTYYYAPDVDINGVPRPIDSGLDRGAFEENNDVDLPVGFISIDSGALIALSTDVTLNLSASDTGGSGLSRMRFSNDGTTWSPWRDYADIWPYWNLNDPAYGGDDADGTKTVYAQFIDRAGNISETASDTIVFNPQPPTGTIHINGGAEYATSDTVDLTISGVDNSGLGSLEMSFSNNGTDWTEPEPYATSKSNWDMADIAYGGTTGDGVKMVYVKIEDTLEQSVVVFDGIILDTTHPGSATLAFTDTSTVTFDGPDAFTTAPVVALDVSAVDADAYGVAEMSFSNNGSVWSDWEVYGTSKASWDITDGTYGGVGGNGAKTVYVRFRDPAGNPSPDPQVNASIVYDSAGPTGGVVASTSHAISVRSNDNTIDVDWSGAVDAFSGIGGVSYEWSESALTVPDDSVDSLGASGSTTSAALNDGDAWYFHLRIKDKAGNWASPVHFGPFLIHVAASTDNDFNNDGTSDVPVFYDYGNANSGLWTFRTDAVELAEPTLEWASGPGNFDWSRAKVTSGDFNADGIADVAVLYNYGGGKSGIWTFITSDSPSGYATPKLAWASGAGDFDWARSKVTSGDFNGDGRSDVAVLYDYGNATSGLWTFITSPSPSGIATPDLKWTSGAGNFDWSRAKVTSGNFNDDQFGDVGILYNYGNASSGFWTIRIAATAELRLEWASGAGQFDWTRSKITSGDFNNDGLADIGILYNYGNHDSGWWTFRTGATPQSATPYFEWASGPGNLDWSRCKVTSGYFNGDAFSDIGILYDYGNARSGVWTIGSNDPSPSALNLEWVSEPGGFDWAKSVLP